MHMIAYFKFTDNIGDNTAGIHQTHHSNHLTTQLKKSFVTMVS